MQIFKYVALTICLCFMLTSVSANDIRLEIYPSNVTIKAGDSIEFTAVAYTKYGTMKTPERLQWTATIGSIDQRSGVFMAPQTAGFGTITARSGHLQANAQVTVKTFAPPISRIVVNPPQMTLTIGQSYRFTATAYDMFNRPVQANLIWRSNGQIDQSTGTFVANTPGQFSITVSAQDAAVTGMAIVTVSQPSVVTRLEITPSNPQVAVGQGLQFQVVAYDNFGRVVSCNPSWSTNGGNINPSNGYYQAHYTPGPYQVWVRDQTTGIRATTSVIILGTPTPPIPPTPPSDARVIITKFDMGGNFLTPKVKVDVEVYGTNIQTVKLYYMVSGRLKEIDAASCQNGQKIHLKGEVVLGTTVFEVILYDNMDREVARTRKRL